MEFVMAATTPTAVTAGTAETAAAAVTAAWRQLEASTLL